MGGRHPTAASSAFESERPQRLVLAEHDSDTVRGDALGDIHPLKDSAGSEVGQEGTAETGQHCLVDADAQMAHLVPLGTAR